MQPPVRVTGDPNIDWIILIATGVFCLYWVKALRLAREGARRLLWNLAIAVLVFVVCQFVLTAMRVQPNAAVLTSAIAGAVALSSRSTRRSRYISKSVKRAVIARDLKGEAYDSSKHHIDHVWPHSRGGSNTEDNLRVIEKRKNLKKGAKRPRMRDMF